MRTLPPVDPDAPGWARTPVTDADVRRDAFAAVALFAGSLLSMVLWTIAGLYDDPLTGPGAAALLAASTLPLALRRRYPVPVLAAVSVAFIATVSLEVSETLILNIALFTGFYSVGAWEPRRRLATWARGSVVVVMLVWLAIGLVQAATDPETIKKFEEDGGIAGGMFSPLVAYLLIQILTNVLYFGAAWSFGERAWSSARDRARNRWRDHQLQAERIRSEAQAMTISRLQLARELHDAVAHHVSVMGLQTSAARALLEADADREKVTAALEHVEDSARQAIDELHTLIGTLRDEATNPAAADEPGEALASLGVGSVPQLVEETRGTGTEVDLQVIGTPFPLTPVTSLNVYRIVQEALTNVRRHAGATARADVRLRYLDDALEIEVSDDGAGAPVVRRPGRGGLGIVGMRERVAAEGGTLHVGAALPRGFVVRALLPRKCSTADAVRASVSAGGSDE
ncbi:signal transduction histidine kinase [Flavimobilis soli]|uniref:histidine kinase n=1 Tax=Flavimobilis soli TaxID=442709 RepID=A0A2A9E9A8_9MICO|nr:sensor histidine kinase [Flavimobilis soli]PFG35413.1 signal transduction histidine kinase [Flavimobilis soli]